MLSERRIAKAGVLLEQSRYLRAARILPEADTICLRAYDLRERDIIWSSYYGQGRKELGEKTRRRA